MQEFDLQTKEWKVMGFGYQSISKSWLESQRRAADNVAVYESY